MHEPTTAPEPAVPPLRHGQAFTAGIVAAVAAEGHEAFTLRLRGMYPWVEALAPTQLDAMVAELVPIATECARARHFDELAHAILRWQDAAGTVRPARTSPMMER